MASDIQVFDYAAKRRARNRVGRDHLFLFDLAGERLADRLADIRRSFDTILKIGSRDNAAIPCQTLHVMDHAGPASFIADEDMLPLKAASLDLIFSVLNLHSVNDLPGALMQINKALKPDGLFLGAMFGGETLYQLRACLQQAELELAGGTAPRIFPFADKQQMGGLMQRAGFALPVVDSDLITVTYDNLDKLYADLRGMGEANIIAARNKAIPPRDLFARTQELYTQLYAQKDGRLPVTFEVIFLSGWAPHSSQQQPLKPGSAQTRLADVLETSEGTLDD